MVRETNLVAPDWEDQAWSHERAYETLRKTPMHVAHRTIGPFLEAYEIVALRLADRLPSRPVEKKDFLAECIGFAKMRWLQRTLYSPESISKNLFEGAMQLAANRKAARTRRRRTAGAPARLRRRTDRGGRVGAGDPPDGQ